MCAVVCLRALMARQAVQLITNPPIARTAVDHVVDVDVLAPVTTRGPQTGNRADGSRPWSRC
jgi:hypothetical protein